jgi:DNA-binding NarL/FixJ family response regulator
MRYYPQKMISYPIPIRVALVEDRQETRERFASVVCGHPGLRLEFAAATGQSMLAWLEKNEPDVLLVDLGLPDLPGLAVISFCSQVHPRTDIMVITMFEDNEHVVRSIEAGASGYLLKDSVEEVVVDSILQLRAGGAPMSPVIARRLLTRMRPTKVGPTPSPLPKGLALTARENEVLGLIARGFRYSEIAELQKVAVSTVHTQIKSIYSKLAVHSKTEAVFEAGRLGLLPPVHSN